MPGHHMTAGDSAGGDLGGEYPNPTIDTSALLDKLPSYATLAAAISGGLLSGDYFFINTVLGLEDVKLLVKIP